MPNTTIILGPPGTGKTHDLMGVMEKEMASGIKPDAIAYCSFTKRAVLVAQQRAANKFHFEPEEMPYARTIHSLAFRLSGMSHEQVFTRKHLWLLGDTLGLKFSRKVEIDEPVMGGLLGDRYLFMEGYGAARGLPLDAVWSQFATHDMNFHEFKRFCEMKARYMAERGLVDFNGMLDCEQECPVKVAIIDEAQDLSTIQWRFMRSAFKNVERIYIAGDDDQSIFQWSGADVQHFLQLKGKRKVLGQSYRLPQAIFEVAQSIASRIGQRYEKVWHPRPEAGEVEYCSWPEDIDLEQPGTWLLLARNIYWLQAWVSVCRAVGVPYLYRGEPSIDQAHVQAIQAHVDLGKGKGLSVRAAKSLWEALGLSKKSFPSGKQEYGAADFKGHMREGHWYQVLTGIAESDRDYYRSLLRRGESITGVPRIAINTIHGVKGEEADHVGLLTDMTPRSWAGFELNPDAEHRVFYVGATRARKKLWVVRPQETYGYVI